MADIFDEEGTEEGGKETEKPEIKVYLQKLASGDRGGRDENGRLLPGHTANPVGRPKRADERALIAAMDRALPPDKVEKALKDALAWAYEYKSPKLVLALVQFVVSYQVGMPVQRSISASGKLESIIGRLSAMDESEFEAVERAMRGE